MCSFNIQLVYTESVKTELILKLRFEYTVLWEQYQSFSCRLCPYLAVLQTHSWIGILCNAQSRESRAGNNKKGCCFLNTSRTGELRPRVCWRSMSLLLVLVNLLLCYTQKCCLNACSSEAAHLQASWISSTLTSILHCPDRSLRLETTADPSQIAFELNKSFPNTK